MADGNDLRRAEPPIAGDEVATLLGSLERVRSFIGWKCGDLDDAGIRTTAAASSITLGGLLKHLAYVEDDHFAALWLGREATGPPWDAVDRTGHDWDWRVNDDDSPDGLMTLWRGAVARSRTIVDEALEHGGLEQHGRFTDPETGESPNLRRILIDLIEEYARHAGHADIVREAIDGVVGEDPPGYVPV